MKNSCVVSIGGIGNQLWQLAFAHKLSEAEPVNMVLIDNPKANNSHLYIGAEVISNLTKICKHRISHSSYKYRNPMVRRKFVPESNWARHFIDSRNLNWQNLSGIDIQKSSVHLGFYQSLKFLRKEVSIVLDELELFLSAQNVSHVISEVRDYAVIHLRGGDYYQDRHKNVFGVLDDTYYQRLTSKLAEYGFDRAFVVTDDLINCAQRLRKISQIELVYLDGLSEISTLKLMSNAKAVGIANSSFSWWGGMLSQQKGGIVHAPHPWFKFHTLQNLNADIYDSITIKIDSSFIN
jgi:hypothetical protein